VFENLFAIKTRYLNSGTVGWWQDIIWAIEITETAQPRLVYWAEEDMSPVVMDWELEDQGPLPGSPLPALQNWAQQFLFAEAAVRLGQPIVAGGAAGSTISLIGSPGTPATIAGVGSGTAGGRQPPFDISTLQRFLSSVTIGPPLLLPNLPPTSRAGLAAVLAQSVNQRERETLAALALAARQDPVFGGANPRSLPALLAEQVGAPLLQSSIIGRMLWPQLIQGADRSATTGNVDLLALIRALFLSYAPSVDTRAEVKETR